MSMYSDQSMHHSNVKSPRSKKLAVSLSKVSKVYKLYSRHLYRVAEALMPGYGKKYHQEFHALTDISFSVQSGQTVGIIGENGSGKSTLLQIICGIIKPTGGKVVVNGRISALLELGAGFNIEFTGRENVYLNGSILGMGKTEIDNCVDQIISFADIGDFIDQPVKIYSSGMYVRLAFAVAINVNPNILIVDEALSVGDTSFQAKCFAKFKEFQDKGVTILFVTHSMDLVTRYCQSAILLDHGKILKTGPAKTVVDEYHRRIVNCSQNGNDSSSTLSDFCEYNDEQKGIGTSDPRNTLDGDTEASGIDATPYEPWATNLYNSEPSASKRRIQPAYQINANENRYGNGSAEIIELGIDSLGDENISSFMHGEPYRFWFKTLFHENLVNPITAFTIKDVKGLDLTGTNTMYKDINIGEVQKGDIVLTEFEQRMMLNPGGYLLSFGCAGFESGEYVVYDRRYDVIVFDVISDQLSVGMFDLDSKIKISKVKE